MNGISVHEVKRPKAIRIGARLSYFCPACNEPHHVPVSGANAWSFNDDVFAPTLGPSVRHTFTFSGVRPDRVCHYFVREGRIEYCADCTHAMSGQIRELPEVIPGRDGQDVEVASELSDEARAKMQQLVALGSAANALYVVMSFAGADGPGQAQKLRVYQRLVAAINAVVPQTVTCVYCGHAFPEGTPAAGADQLTAHIKVCDKHPMRAAERRVKAIEEAARDVVAAWHAGEMTHELIESLDAARRDTSGAA